MSLRGSGCKQQALNPGGFIGRKSGADITSSKIYWKESWCSQNQQEAKEQAWERGKTKGTQTVISEQSARMSDLAGCMLPLIILGVLFWLCFWPQRQRPS